MFLHPWNSENYRRISNGRCQERDESKKATCRQYANSLCTGETFVESAGWKLVCEIVPYSKILISTMVMTMSIF